MTRRRRWLAGAVVAAFAVALGVWLARGPRDPGSPRPSPPAPDVAPGDPPGPPPWGDAPNVTDEERRFLDEAVASLEEPLLWHAGVQISLLEELAAWLRKRHPDTWRSELDRIVRAAFPARADEMLALWDAREAYARWLRDHRDELARMSPDARQDELWKARRDFFEQDADELFEEALRQRSVARTLEEVESQADRPIEARFDTYLTGIEDTYGDETGSFLRARRQEVIDRFLAVPSVQADLEPLDAGERNELLRSLRQAAGMDEPALARWRELDRRRDARWEQGQQYMEAREQAVENHRGAALDRRLDALRSHFFGPEATTIANEEEFGYFRFEQRRVHGRN